MKRIILSLSFASLLIVGCNTKESKMNELIRSDMKEYLNDYSSYEPIKNTIDTMYFICADTNCLWNAEQYVGSFNENQRLEIEKEKLEAEPYSYDRIYTDYAYSKVYKINYHLNEINDKIERNHKWMAIEQSEIVNAMHSMPKEIVGYRIIHQFRAKNQYGISKLVYRRYYVDKDIENIIYKSEPNDSEVNKYDFLMILQQEVK